MMTAICQLNQIFVVNATKTGLTATKSGSISMNHFSTLTMLANFLHLFGLKEHERLSEILDIPIPQYHFNFWFSEDVYLNTNVFIILNLPR